MECQSSPLTRGVFVASASALALEVGLLRLFSLAHFFHFATLAVSVALLGFGAGGTLLVLRPRLAGLLSQRLPQALWGQAATVPVSYLLLNHLPLDTFQLGWSAGQWLILVAYYLALVLPFLAAGLLIGAAFVLVPERSHRLYMANLLGSAVGAGASLAGQLLPGGWGAVAVAAAFPLLGAWKPGRWRWLAAGGLALLVAMLAARPSALGPSLSPHKRLSQLRLYPETRVITTLWTPAARLDVIASPVIRSAPGLSLGFAGELPSGLGLTEDGDNLSILVDEGVGEGGAYLDHLPEALGYQLARPERVLLLHPRGGLQVALAVRAGVRRILALEEDPFLAAAATRHSPVLGHPAVEVRAGGIRASLAAEEEGYPLAVIPLPDSFQTVAAGSYSLRESYVYTVEGVGALWERVAPGGFLLVTRWVQVPPSEGLRAWGLVLEATGSGPESLAAYRSFQTVTILAKKGPLTAAEIERVRAFASSRGYDLVYLPGLSAQETNRFHRLPEPVHARTFAELLASESRESFYAAYPFAVEPASDDRPFFFHFFTLDQWPELRARLGKTYEAFAGAGILLLAVLLALSLLAALLLIVSPAVLLGPAFPLRAAPLVYFAALGVAFLFLEIALIQKLILLLGQPVYALSLVLVGLLGASGLGSLLSVRLPRGWPAALLALGAAALPLLLEPGVARALGWPLWGRVAYGLAVLTPLGLLMGMPFPQGLEAVRGAQPRWVPWAWAINGATSVVSALLASVVSLALGIRALVWIAALGYGLAALAQRALPQAPRPDRGHSQPWGRC